MTEEGWINSFSCRKSHTIEQTAGAGEGYQIRIHVHYGAAIDDDGDKGEDVYLNGLCKPDFGDIRFTDGEGKNLLPYWMESKNNGKDAIFWVRVTENLSTDDRTIYIYYNNVTAATTSSGKDTFLVFDDFDDGDTTGWTVGGGTFDVEFKDLPEWMPPDGYLRSKNSSGGASFARRSEFGLAQTAIECKVCCPTNVREAGILFHWNGAADGDVKNTYLFRLYNTTTWEFWINQADSWTKLDSGSGSYTTNTWYKLGLRMYDAVYSMTIDDVVVGSTTSYYLPYGYVGVRSRLNEYRYWDDFRVRKFVSPEPEHLGWGELEIGGTIVVGKDALVTGYASKATKITSSYHPVMKVVSMSYDMMTKKWSKKLDTVQTPLIQNITIEGNGQNNGIEIEDVYGCQIRNVTVSNCLYGITLRRVGYFVEGTNITHTKIMDTKFGIRFTCPSGVEGSFAYTHISDVHIELKYTDYATGIMVGAYAKSYSSFIKANIILNKSTQTGVSLGLNSYLIGSLINLAVVYLGSNPETAGIGIWRNTNTQAADWSDNQGKIFLNHFHLDNPVVEWPNPLGYDNDIALVGA